MNLFCPVSLRVFKSRKALLSPKLSRIWVAWPEKSQMSYNEVVIRRTLSSELSQVLAGSRLGAFKWRTPFSLITENKDKRSVKRIG